VLSLCVVLVDRLLSLSVFLVDRLLACQLLCRGFLVPLAACFDADLLPVVVVVVVVVVDVDVDADAVVGVGFGLQRPAGATLRACAVC
jgi:hypothetical protein